MCSKSTKKLAKDRFLKTLKYQFGGTLQTYDKHREDREQIPNIIYFISKTHVYN
jgi:hypothetical protein